MTLSQCQYHLLPLGMNSGAFGLPIGYRPLSSIVNDDWSEEPKKDSSTTGKHPLSPPWGDYSESSDSNGNSSSNSDSTPSSYPSSSPFPTPTALDDDERKSYSIEQQLFQTLVHKASHNRQNNRHQHHARTSPNQRRRNYYISSSGEYSISGEDDDAEDELQQEFIDDGDENNERHHGRDYSQSSSLLSSDDEYLRQTRIRNNIHLDDTQSMISSLTGDGVSTRYYQQYYVNADHHHPHPHQTPTHPTKNKSDGAVFINPCGFSHQDNQYSSPKKVSECVETVSLCKLQAEKITCHVRN